MYKRLFLAAVAVVALLATPSFSEAGCGVLGLRRAVVVNRVAVVNHVAVQRVVVAAPVIAVRSAFIAEPVRSFTLVDSFASPVVGLSASSQLEVERLRLEIEKLKLELRRP